MASFTQALNNHIPFGTEMFFTPLMHYVSRTERTVQQNCAARIAAFFSTMAITAEAVVSFVATIFTSIAFVLTGFNKNVFKLMKGFYNNTMLCAVGFLIPTLAITFVHPLAGYRMIDYTKKVCDKIHLKN
jgi:hypothetical protein